MDRVTVAHSAQEMESFRSAWHSLQSTGSYCLFQDFAWNQQAARIFPAREIPFVIFVETEGGMAIVPAAITRRGLTLLGEELFDYRDVLAMGDDRALLLAWRKLAEIAEERTLDFEVKAVREAACGFRPSIRQGFQSRWFANAPAVRRCDPISKPPSRLKRNLQRMMAEGCKLEIFHGDDTAVVRNIFRLKAEQDERSLFCDPLRVEMACAMAESGGHKCEIFALVNGTSLVAALITFLDRSRGEDIRRLYTIYYSRQWAQYSPGRSLMQYAIQSSLASDMDVDLMTGEQPYKQRFATFNEPLYTLRATSRMLFDLDDGELQSAPKLRNKLSYSTP